MGYVRFSKRAVFDEFPEELFFDNDIVWHQQQLGKIGQVSTSNLTLDGNDLYSMVHVSDLVQRISRRREFKTRIENGRTICLCHDVERGFGHNHVDPNFAEFAHRTSSHLMILNCTRIKCHTRNGTRELWIE